MRYVLLSAAALATFAVTAFMVPGCADHGPQTGTGAAEGAKGSSAEGPEVTPTAVAVKAKQAPGMQKIGDFVAQYNRATHTFTINPVTSVYTLANGVQAPTAATKATPESVDGLNDVQGATHASNTVDLVSTNCSDVPGTSFQCDVQLRSFYTRTLTNTYVEVTNIVGADGGFPTGHSPTNPNLATSDPLGRPTSLGIWSYTNAAQSTNAISNVLVPPSVSSVDSKATVTWHFQNADDAVVSYDLAVWGSLGFGSYKPTFANADTTGDVNTTGGYYNACENGSFFDSKSTPKDVALPFDFTIYNTNVSQVSMDQSGNMSFGTVLPSTTGIPIALPSTSAPEPGLFPFWDNLVGDSNDASADEGVLCDATLGTSPNRKFIVEWQNFDVKGNGSTGIKDGKNLGFNVDFEVWLYEGTSEIDMVYESMVGATGVNDGRQTGNMATIGLQNETGTVATATYKSGVIASGFNANGTPVTTVGYVPAP